VHSAVDSCQVCWQDAQRFQKAGSGLRQRAQSGSRSVPPFSGAPVPQREQVIQRLRHRSQTGVLVAREMPIRPLPADPQMLQGRSGPGRQPWQTGPASVTAATRRLFPALRAGLPAPRITVPAVLADGLPAVVEAGWLADLPALAAEHCPGLASAPGEKAQPLDRDAERPLPDNGRGRLPRDGHLAARWRT
jgi:hypothetical protein